MAPKRKSSLERSALAAKRKRLERQEESENARDTRLQQNRLRSSSYRHNATENQAPDYLREQSSGQSTSAFTRHSRQERQSTRQRSPRQQASNSPGDSELIRNRLRSSTCRPQAPEVQTLHCPRRQSSSGRSTSSSTRQRSPRQQASNGPGDSELIRNRLRSSTLGTNAAEEHALHRPRRRSSLGRSTVAATRQRLLRQGESEEARATRLTENMQRSSAYRAGALREQPEDSSFSPRLLRWTCKEASALNYNPLIDYESDDSLSISSMTFICEHCSAKKWKNERAGICCSAGKVQLAPLQPLPELLLALLLGDHPDSPHFLKLIRCYNSAFQMTSFGGKVSYESGYMPTFKVQGQVYHRIGSLLPAPGVSPQFLQLYFLGDSAEETRIRCNLNSNLRTHIVSGLQSMLHERNTYIRDFKTVIERQDVRSLQVVIHADKKPAGEHSGRYNAPVTIEVAIVLVDQQISEKRDIVLITITGALRRISETHRSYDCLQYPLMFCSGEDGYTVALPLLNPVTNQPITKKISSSNFYAYRMMDRCNQENHLLYFRSLLNQFWVDMWAKIETERLNYLRFYQAKLRADQYIHLQDAMTATYTT